MVRCKTRLAIEFFFFFILSSHLDENGAVIRTQGQFDWREGSRAWESLESLGGQGDDFYLVYVDRSPARAASAR